MYRRSKKYVLVYFFISLYALSPIILLLTGFFEGNNSVLPIGDAVLLILCSFTFITGFIASLVVNRLIARNQGADENYQINVTVYDWYSIGFFMLAVSLMEIFQYFFYEHAILWVIGSLLFFLSGYLIGARRMIGVYISLINFLFILIFDFFSMIVNSYDQDFTEAFLPIIIFGLFSANIAYRLYCVRKITAE